MLGANPSCCAYPGQGYAGTTEGTDVEPPFIASATTPTNPPVEGGDADQGARGHRAADATP